MAIFNWSPCTVYTPDVQEKGGQYKKEIAKYFNDNIDSRRQDYGRRHFILFVNILNLFGALMPPGFTSFHGRKRITI